MCCVGSVWPPYLTPIGLSRQVPRCAVQGRDTSVRDTKSKGRIFKGTFCLRDAFSKGRNIGDFSFGDTTVRDMAVISDTASGACCFIVSQ